MRRFSLVVIFISLFLAFSGCEKKPVGGVSKMHWDRDMCERCKMAISERKYALQLIDPKTKKSYKFDDIGCAILWLDEEHIPWADSAIIWITDAKTGEWIDAREALYTDDSITPMAFGFAAYSKKTAPKGHQLHNLEYVKKMIFDIEKLNKQKVNR
jgi:nitrous oxide reductase accessory protein NosL